MLKCQTDCRLIDLFCFFVNIAVLSFMMAPLAFRLGLSDIQF